MDTQPDKEQLFWSLSAQAQELHEDVQAALELTPLMPAPVFKHGERQSWPSKKGDPLKNYFKWLEKILLDRWNKRETRYITSLILQGRIDDADRYLHLFYSYSMWNIRCLEVFLRGLTRATVKTNMVDILYSQLTNNGTDKSQIAKYESGYAPIIEIDNDMALGILSWFGIEQIATKVLSQLINRSRLTTGKTINLARIYDSGIETCNEVLANEFYGKVARGEARAWNWDGQAPDTDTTKLVQLLMNDPTSEELQKELSDCKAYWDKTAMKAVKLIDNMAQFQSALDDIEASSQLLAQRASSSRGQHAARTRKSNKLVEQFFKDMPNVQNFIAQAYQWSRYITFIHEEVEKKKRSQK
jgi:hypothetical protein